MSDHMITLRDMEFSYPKMAAPLFNHLDLDVGTGTICGMLGPNGSGKSTLLKLMAGLIFPDHGSCRVLDDEPAQRAPGFLADVFSCPRNCLFPPSVPTCMKNAMPRSTRHTMPPFFPLSCRNSSCRATGN